jgi:S-disulfanyl-L-cysteine oxidoreductase SoxD
MFWLRVAASSLAGIAFGTAAIADGPGRVAAADEIHLWDIDVLPDGSGLPVGSGSATLGQQVFAENCAACHGEKGEGGIGGPLFGGDGTLVSEKPVKTVGSYWPFATTLYDYVRRAMPYTAPETLTDDEVYAVSAYILSLNGIVGPDAVLDQASLPKVQMPNRAGFVADSEFREIHNARQQK